MKSRTLGILFFFLVQSVTAQSLSERITRAYNSFENDPQLGYGLSSLTVLNAQTGEVIFSRNAQTALAPASTLKTITSATGFQLLGKDFTWKTSLGYNGIISNGTLKGDLILTGSGDPTLGSSRYHQTKAELLLEKWTNAVKLAGIRKVEGRVIVDDSLFGSQTVPQGWIWQDIGNYYGAGATSASWRENEFGLIFKAGSRVGDTVRLLGPEPSIPGLKIINEVLTGKSGSGDNVYAYSSPYSELVYARGTYGIDLNKTIKASIPDPAMQLAIELKDHLYRSGLKVSLATTWRKLRSENRSFEPVSKMISEHQSPPLSQVVYWLNQKSLNLYAENLLKTIAVQQGKKGSFDEGIDVIKDLWSRQLNLDKNSLNILDGSGLSPENRVSTLTMARILQAAAKEPWFDSFYNSLPLYNEMKMKSGSIRNVLCYTGYEKSSSGTQLIFSFMTNNYNGSTSSIKQKMFKVLDVIK